MWLLLVLALGARSPAEITGHWSFEDQDLYLSARIGFPLLAMDFETALGTEFGYAGVGAMAGVPGVNGQSVPVMKFPPTGVWGGYQIHPNAGANGGGAAINQYTIILDVLFPEASSSQRRALFKTLFNGDAEFLVNANNRLGPGTGYASAELQPDTWHRVAFAVDLAATPPAIAYFLDGVKAGEADPGQGLDGRWAIRTSGSEWGLYFNRDDNGETAVGYLSSLQFRNERIPDALLAALGGPSADGIPIGPIAHPYLAHVEPSPESVLIPERSTVPPRPWIQAVIMDGTNPVDLATLALQLDGVRVAAETIQSGGTNTIRFTPGALLPPLSRHAVIVTYADATGNHYTNQWEFLVGPYEALPEGAAGPPGSASTRGFLVRTVQAPLGTVFSPGNNFFHALQQLNGTLLDDGGRGITNVAPPGPVGGYHEVDRINFHLLPTSFGMFRDDQTFPGIPSAEGGSELFATEVLAFLELAAGLHHFGVSVSVDRTDNRTDDGFGLFCGAPARSIFAPRVGSFHRNVTNAFISTNNNNEFTLYAPVDGLYPFRLVHFQTYHDASLEWYSIDRQTNTRILINDDANPRAIRAFPHSTAALAGKPYVAEVSPRDGVFGVAPGEPVAALILDDQAQADTNTLQLWLNDVRVPVSVTAEAGRTWVRYSPDAARLEETNRLQLVFGDRALPEPAWFTNEWMFTIAVSTDPETWVAGQWDFDFCDLSPTVGADLEYLDGPGGLTDSQTLFGTTTQFGISDIHDVPASVMFVPGMPDNRIGYVMRHGIPANGGGSRVNQFTLIFDIYWVPPPASTYFGALINFDLANTSDGDLFFNETRGLIGQGDYEGDVVMHTREWYRVSFAIDMAATPPVVTKYVDGVKHADQYWPNNELDGQRRSLPLAGAVLFGDGDDGERIACYVSSIQIRAGKLPDADLEALGGPSANGIPLDVGEPDPPLEARLLHRHQQGRLKLAWPAPFEGHALESATRLDPSDWQPVAGVTGTCAILPMGSEARFYRLRRP